MIASRFILTQMIPARVIERKRDGEPVPPEELRSFFEGYLEGGVDDSQMSAFLMASYFAGLDPGETEVLLEAMVGSGATLEWDVGRPCVDKHSTGGVGDKVSLALAPLAASLGLAVPMISGRGLGHTGGTLDKLAAIPGFRTGLALAEFRRALDRVGCAVIGQTPEIAPLDGRIYALRDVTGTVQILPVIAASIMSKKIAEGVSGLLLDVKVGPAAFIPEQDRAVELALRMIGLGESRGVRTRALLTAMDRPLGFAIGNALETAEAIACLRGEGPPDLRVLVARQAAELLVLARGTEWAESRVREGEAEATAALDDGRALDRFRRWVEAQGGDPRVADDLGILPQASCRREVRALSGGRVAKVKPRQLGEGVVALGGGRRRIGDVLDLSVGFEVPVKPGSVVVRGDPLGTVHAGNEDSLDFGEWLLRDAVRIDGDADDSQDRSRPLVSHVVDLSGVRRDVSKAT